MVPGVPLEQPMNIYESKSISMTSNICIVDTCTHTHTHISIYEYRER